MTTFDSVQIGARDVDETIDICRRLLGVAPSRIPAGTPRFQLGCGAIEIDPGEPGLRSIRFGGLPAGAWPTGPAAFHGLSVGTRKTRTGGTEPPAVARDVVTAIDHVVVNTTDPERAIALWRDRLGVRLALDRTFANRGLRMLFFRSGGVTLEFVAPAGAPPGSAEPDRLFGIAYRVADLRACVARLTAEDFNPSEIRLGHKPGTRVATVRGEPAGIPTLLIEDPSRS